MRIQDLRETLHERSVDVGGPVADRTTQIAVRVRQVRRRRRTAAAVGGAAGVLVLAGGVLLARPGGSAPAPADPGMVRTPDPAPPGAPAATRVGGWSYPGTLVVGGRTYGRGSSYLTDPGSRRLELTTGSAGTPRVLAWSSTSGTQGFTSVTVDGRVVSRSRAGSLESGVVLAAGQAHVVVVRADNLGPRQVLALTTYDALPAR